MQYVFFEKKHMQRTIGSGAKPQMGNFPEFLCEK